MLNSSYRNTSVLFRCILSKKKMSQMVTSCQPLPGLRNGERLAYGPDQRTSTSVNEGKLHFPQIRGAFFISRFERATSQTSAGAAQLSHHSTKPGPPSDDDPRERSINLRRSSVPNLGLFCYSPHVPPGPFPHPSQAAYNCPTGGRL